jgi:aspartate aminotransferase
VLSDHLVARLRGAGVKVARPDGGFYLFPDFGGHREALAARGVKDAPSLCERLLEDTGVAMLPGSNFGRPKRELITRLAFVDFDGAAALRLAEPDAAYDRAWLDAACGPTVEAIDRVVAWLAH